MGSNLAVKTQAFNPGENQEWLGSRHGTQEMDPVTLDGAALIAIFPTGIVPSGVVLAKSSVTGKYTRYANAGANGLGTPLGHLFTTVDLTDGGLVPAGADHTGSILWHGEIVEAKLPTGHGLDAGAKTAMPMFRYV